MANISSDNVCTRCGKKRIVVKTYTKKVGNSSVTYTQTACSDPECQKKVDNDNKQDYLKRRKFRDEQEKKELERKKRTAQNFKNKMANRKSSR
jgi:hypothetical protein